MNSIVVGLDGSEKSFRALEMALTIAKRFGASLVTLTVEETPRFGETIDEIQAQKEDEDVYSRDIVRKAHEASKKAGVAIKSHVLVGHPAKTIAKYLAESKADLLVVGSIEHGPLYEAITNSTCLGLLRATSCPILVVH
jgi:nucleotide-binding universal stress UspA family protein